MEFTATMKDGKGNLFTYSLNADDLFEADKRFQKIAKEFGWLYISM